MDDFESELKISFLEEAEQLLTDVEKCYLNLEANPNDAAILDQIFRIAHNLKGSAKAVGFNDVGNFAHEFESLLLKLKNQVLEINPAIVDLLLKSNDHLATMVRELKESLDAVIDSTELLEQIQAALRGELTEAVTPFDSKPDHQHEITSEELTVDAAGLTESVPLQNQTAEKVESHPKPEEYPPGNNAKAATPSTTTASATATAEESIRVSLARVEKLLNYVGEMVILQSVLHEQALASGDHLRKTIGQLGKVTKEVQNISMGLRMVPIKATFQKMQRIVRDTSQGLNKKVNLQLMGEETELDKTILERVSDPLVHLIRNACDHGIESPEIRRSNGKSEQGLIRLSASHRNGKLVIEVIDDGCGINPEILRRKAIEKKLIPTNSQMTEQEAIQLIFHPGFSTKAVVTDVSGRGVGMDVVKHNIESLQGVVQVETQLGKGTTFKIILPLTLAITDAMVVKVGDGRYVVPLSHIQESLKIEAHEIKFTTALGESLLLRGETIPLFRLQQLLGRRPSNPKESEMIAIVVSGAAEKFAVLVDDIIGQYQVVIKQIGSELQGIRGYSGSSILGDGKPALILELAELVDRMKSNRHSPPKGAAA